MIFPFPNRRYPAVTDITAEELKQMGVSALLLDIDGTLMQTRDQMPAQPVMDWLAAMKRAGFRLYVLSNNKHPKRVEAFAAAIGAPWQHLAGKPRLRGFVRAQQELGLPREALALVGDQTYTDMLGARRFGIKGLLVESTDTDLWYFWPRRLAELPFRKAVER